MGNDIYKFVINIYISHLSSKGDFTPKNRGHRGLGGMTPFEGLWGDLIERDVNHLPTDSKVSLSSSCPIYEERRIRLLT